MTLDDGFSEEVSLDPLGLNPLPADEKVYDSLMRALLERGQQGTTTTTIPHPPGKAETSANAKSSSQEPEGKGSPSSTPDEPPKKKRDPIRTADSLRQLNYAQHLHMLMKPYVGDCGGHPAFMEIMGQIYQECGCPDDPMAKMSIQQMVLYHELIAVLNRSGVEAPSIEVAKEYFAAAHRMAGDYRKAADQLRDILYSIAERTASQNGKPANKAVILDHPQKRTTKKTG